MRMSGAKSLAEIAEGIELQAVSGDPQVAVRGMALDSRQVLPGDLYTCVHGFNFDGHDFAAEALKKGAVALVVERLLPFAVPQIQVADVRRVIGPMAAAFYDQPCSSLELAGVTGTNGKTTITYLIEKIGVKHGKKAGLIGTMGARIAGREFAGERTTPEAIEIQKLLREMVNEGVTLAAMEVSSHALDLGRVVGCEFDAGIFTNLTRDHLDYHKTMEEYFTAKSRLFAGLKGKKQPKVSILNRDDPSFFKLSQVSAAPVASYGLDRDADYRGVNINVTADGVAFEVMYQGKSREIRYATPGLFSVYNVLAAFAWSVERGYSPDVTSEALAEIRGVPGRFESIRLGQPFQVIVDYAHTPDGLKTALRTVRGFTKGKVITVFGCGGERDRGKRPLMGAAAARGSDFVIVTSDNPRMEAPGLIIKEILAGVSGSKYAVLEDRREAIETACRMAEPGDTVLIAGKGHENYQIFGEETRRFDDREEAREVLRGLGHGRVDC